MEQDQQASDELKAARGQALTHALRTMRKHSFTVVQDRGSRAQPPSDQFRRAQRVAADMLDIPVDDADKRIAELASVLLDVATAVQNLVQFERAGRALRGSPRSL